MIGCMRQRMDGHLEFLRYLFLYGTDDQSVIGTGLQLMNIAAFIVRY